MIKYRWKHWSDQQPTVQELSLYYEAMKAVVIYLNLTETEGL